MRRFVGESAQGELVEFLIEPRKHPEPPRQTVSPQDGIDTGWRHVSGPVLTGPRQSPFWLPALPGSALGQSTGAQGWPGLRTLFPTGSQQFDFDDNDALAIGLSKL
jgi:hypothetical protein